MPPILHDEENGKNKCEKTKCDGVLELQVGITREILWIFDQVIRKMCHFVLRKHACVCVCVSERMCVPVCVGGRGCVRACLF